MTTNQKAGNQSGCKEQTRNVDEGIGSILEELEAYICDKLCFCNHIQMTQEERDQCCSNCQMHDKVDNIETEYEKINTFSKSAAYALMEKYRNIVLCKDCIYRAHEKTGYDWCRLAKGLDESLGESEGCSRGKEKE